MYLLLTDRQNFKVLFPPLVLHEYLLNEGMGDKIILNNYVLHNSEKSSLFWGFTSRLRTTECKENQPGYSS